MGYTGIYTVSPSLTKGLFLPRMLLGQLLSHHHLRGWEMPTYFNNKSHMSVGRRICCKMELCDVFQKTKNKGLLDHLLL